MVHEPDSMVAQAMKQIIEVAARDGIITEEEKKLIDLADVSLKFLYEEIKAALEDGIVTNEELIF